MTIFCCHGSSQENAGKEPAHVEGVQPGLHLNRVLRTLGQVIRPTQLGLRETECLLQLTADRLLSHIYTGLVLLGVTLLMLCSLI